MPHPGRSDSCRLALLVGVLSAICCCPAGADQPPKDSPLPPPRVVPQQPEQVIILTPPSFVRPSRLAVWQNYGVDRYGRFRPLVIASPHGPYYLATGKPYPYALLHSLNWLPYVSH